jgi:cation/acetate symporter
MKVAKQARKSVLWATTWIGYFCVLTFNIGFGAITFVLTDPQFLDCSTGRTVPATSGHPSVFTSS